jgi:hypothetical protein
MKRTIETTCTWKDASQCEGCANKGKLNCRWKSGDLILFLIIVFPGMLGTLAGTVIIGLTQGVWWPTIAYILFYPVILGIAEIRFLCSHCPYYAEKGLVLHCLANHGMLKIWRYHPEPMNRLEKTLMVLLGLLFLILLPGSILGYNIWFFTANMSQFGSTILIAVISLTVVTILSIIALAFVMVKQVCANCVNFSCPLNRVDKDRRDAYLMKNPVMKKAWEDSGYTVG